MHTNPKKHPNPHKIMIVSGGAGTSGEQLVHTVLAQFPHSQIQVITMPHLRTDGQLADVLERAEQESATLVHTLVDSRLRNRLSSMATNRKVTAIDLMGLLFDRLESVLDEKPLEEPGLYRRLNKAYFERVEAIEFSNAHDDGRYPEDWPQAEMLLIGASRVGKTPLSLYLSVMGWKVANLPIVPGMEPPSELYQVDRRRVVGLKIAPAQLLAFRNERQRRLGVPGPSKYTDPRYIVEELEEFEKLCKHAGFRMLDVTDKPIETSADELIRLITGRFGTQSRPG